METLQNNCNRLQLYISCRFITWILVQSWTGSEPVVRRLNQIEIWLNQTTGLVWVQNQFAVVRNQTTATLPHAWRSWPASSEPWWIWWKTGFLQTRLTSGLGEQPDGEVGTGARARGMVGDEGILAMTAWCYQLSYQSVIEKTIILTILMCFCFMAYHQYTVCYASFPSQKQVLWATYILMFAVMWWRHLCSNFHHMLQL